MHPNIVMYLYFSNGGHFVARTFRRIDTSTTSFHTIKNTNNIHHTTPFRSKPMGAELLKRKWPGKVVSRGFV